jgi:hypothetical protein
MPVAENVLVHSLIVASRYLQVSYSLQKYGPRPLDSRECLEQLFTQPFKDRRVSDEIVHRGGHVSVMGCPPEMILGNTWYVMSFNVNLALVYASS